LPENARKYVREADLAELGIDDIGHIAHSGFGRNEPLAHMELFINGNAMRLAEWPNKSWTTIRDVPKGKRVIDKSGKPRGTDTDRFGYNGNRPEAWADNPDVWVHGYWMVDWADQYLKVKKIDTENKMVVIEPPQSGYGYKKGQRFRFLNVLEELDSPGEWVLLREKRKLVVWPPQTDGPIDGSVSILAKPLMRIHRAESIALQGLVLECGRSDGIVIEGGSNIAVSHCEIRNLGGTAIRIEGGHSHSVLGCNIHSLGEGGILVNAGDRTTLTPCGHTITDCRIHHFSRWVRTYKVGIRMTGVGITAAHNLIHDAPHTGILYNGNNHTIELNELHRLCLDTGDVGAIYTGRDWTARGTVVRFNYIHDLGGLNHGSNAIYLDDLASGQTIVGNVMYNVWRGVMLGGGRDNLIANNIFVNFRIGIHVDARGIGWSRKLIEGRKGSWDMYGKLDKVPYRKAPYAQQYPSLPNLLDENPLEPVGNRIERNIFVGEKWLDPRNIKMTEFAEKGWCVFKDNVVDADPKFVDPDNGNFALAPQSPALKVGFEPIPFEKIGPRE
jgi:hypothetical protein